MIDKVKEIVTGTSIYKVTPKGDLSWYIKWVSSIFVLSGMLFTSLDIYPWNLWGHLFGVFGWFIVGMLWHDRALIVLNSENNLLVNLQVVLWLMWVKEFLDLPVEHQR